MGDFVFKGANGIPEDDTQGHRPVSTHNQSHVHIHMMNFFKWAEVEVRGAQDVFTLVVIAVT